jgi:riboflavin synthase
MGAQREPLMFTGIVEEMGTLTASVERDGRHELTFDATMALMGTRLGDSIAVNGVCLTAIALTPTTFTVEIQPETQRRTNLGDLQPGDRVNLERPLAADGRFGGHIVQGHIDGTGTLRAHTPDGPAVVVTIEVTPEMLRYIVPQGFIAVDGTSLTVVNVDRAAHTFTVALITHTQASITLPTLALGSRVNIEVDIVAKYIEELARQK